MERTYEDTIRDQELLLGLPVGTLVSVVSAIRALGHPVLGATAQIRTVETYNHPPQGCFVYVHPGLASVTLSLRARERNYEVKPSDVYAAGAYASLSPMAGMAALAELLTGFAADLEERAKLRGRIRYRIPSEIARRDADVVDARNAAEGVRAIIPRMLAGELPAVTPTPKKARGPAFANMDEEEDDDA
jgi:hypothetical protein